MNLVRSLVFSAVALSLLAIPAQRACAVGYPPFGAWAYGSYFPAHGIARSRTVVRSRYGWGGYGNLGYSSTTRIRYGHRPYVGHPYVGYRSYYPRYSYGYHYYRPRVVVAPIVHYRSYYVAPTYYPLPVYIPPVISSPLCGLPVSNGFGLAVSVQPVVSTTGYVPTVGYPFLSNASNPISRHSYVSNTTQPYTMAKRPIPALLTTPDTSISYPEANRVPVGSVNVEADPSSLESVPAVLLEAADSILRAGGYREAAVAYAQLSVRYGTTEQLAGRRFIAQVLGGDLNQAGVILALAEACEMDIRQEHLPGGSLDTLLPSPIVFNAASESLAQHALQNPLGSEPLELIAQWMQLAGETTRAEMFLARARQLAPTTTIVPSSTSESRLASDDGDEAKVDLVSYE